MNFSELQDFDTSMTQEKSNFKKKLAEVQSQKKFAAAAHNSPRSHKRGSPKKTREEQNSSMIDRDLTHLVAKKPKRN